MRYPREHKQHSRKAIIEMAAQLFRQRGFDAVSIDTLMKAAGLTRGGFYGHFKSKRELYEAVLSDDHDFVDRMKARSGSNVSKLKTQGIEVAEGYLHPDHRQGVICGCSLASLAMDTARSTKPAQQAYARVVRELVSEFRRGMHNTDNLDERALGVLATCIGGLLLSSACSADHELSDAISNASSALVKKTLASSLTNFHQESCNQA